MRRFLFAIALSFLAPQLVDAEPYNFTPGDKDRPNDYTPHEYDFTPADKNKPNDYTPREYDFTPGDADKSYDYTPGNPK